MNLLAIDLGTTGVRAVVIGLDGQVLGAHDIDVPIERPFSGSAEQSPEVFWRATVQTVRTALSGAAVEPGDIAAIALAQQRGTFVLADASQRPLTNFVLWMDQRGLPYLDVIEERIGLADYYDVTGLPISIVSPVSKLLWFADHAPEVYQAARHVWPIANVLLARMGVRQPPVDHATASSFALLDPSSRQWALGVIEALGLDAAKLPQLVPPGTVVGELSDAAAASELGLALGTPIVIGGGDQQCAALGSGMLEVGQALIQLGTATGVMAAVDGPVRDALRTIPVMCHAAPGQWEMEGHTQASGIILQRFRDEFAASEEAVASRLQRDAYEFLSDEARFSPPGALGLLFLPLLNGSTAPINYPYSSGVLVGLRTAHGRQDVLRAMMEGMVFESRWILEHIERNGVPLDSIRFSGGGSRSPLWCQMHADILGRSVTRVGTRYTTGVGAAICAGLGVGLFVDAKAGVTALSRMAESYEPDSSTGAVYDRLYTLFRATFSALRQANVFEGLHALHAGKPLA